MSTLNLTFKHKVVLTILAPVVVGVLVHRVPKVLSDLFPSQPDGKIAELSRNQLRLLFDKGFRKVGEDNQRFLSAIVLDNAGIAAFIASYDYFRDISRNSAPWTKEQQALLFGYFFTLMIASHWFRQVSCRIVAPIVQNASFGGETLGKIFRSLGPSDCQIAIVEEEEGVNDQQLPTGKA